DKGAAAAPPLTTEQVLVLRSPQISPASADIMHEAEIKKQIMFVVSENVIPKNGGYIGFRNLDLSFIRELELNATANPTQGKGGNKAPATKPAPKKATAPQSGKAKGKKQPAFDLSSLFAGQGIKAEIKEVRGVHDLYFVFKNEKAHAAEPLLSFSNIKFLEERKK